MASPKEAPQIPIVKNASFQKLKEHLAVMETDLLKFESGVKVAGTRVRNSAQIIKVICQDIRASVIEAKSKM